MTIPQQLLTAFAILVSLPLVIKLLWKIRLLPFVIGLSLPYLMGRQWTAAHRTVYLALLIGGCDIPHRGRRAHGAVAQGTPACHSEAVGAHNGIRGQRDG